MLVTYDAYSSRFSGKISMLLTTVKRGALIALAVMNCLGVAIGDDEPSRAARPERSEARPVVIAGRAEGAIHLDGVLDEPAWAQAGVIAQLRQQSPHPGEVTSFGTEIRVLVDAENLYFGITCQDPDPGRIAVHTMQRDGNLRGDDSLAIVLDTFGDGRRGYYFRINAVGARQDGLISGSETASSDWDGIWNVHTRRSPKGWSAEIRIPAQTLHFNPDLDAWGFNVERSVIRSRLTLRWSGARLDARLYDLRRAGRLGGVKVLRQGKGLTISPYGLVRAVSDKQEERRSTTGDVGLDLNYNLTPDLSGVLTVNTDFAETEVDTRQINLTRFPLIFPEKRSFFLEGSNLFGFGAGLGHNFIPFFSRRIGLREGQTVPIDLGFKLLGRSGPWSVALLDAQLAAGPVSESTNLFAGRITRDVGEKLTLGALLTHGDPDGVHDNALAGIDLLWRSSRFRGDKNLSFGLWGALSSGDNPEGRHHGWGFKVDYPNDLWDLFFVYKEFGEGLDPALGFLPRPGTRWVQTGGSYQPRPEGGAFDWVRQAFFELYFSYVEDFDGQAQSWRVFTAPFNVVTESGEHLEANVVPQFERITAPFEISDGVVIPEGAYHFTRYRAEAQSSRHRPWRVGGTVWFGPFYTGRLTQVEAFISYATSSGHLQLEASAEDNNAHLPQGDFTQQLWQLKGAWAFTPDLILSAFAQYDSDSRNLGLNTRLRWTIEPGDDLYFVWYRAFQRPLGDAGSLSLHPIADRLVLKLRWTFRR